jgi:hypothetical protein
MGKMIRLIVVVVALVAFGMAGMAAAADFYVAKDKTGKMAVVDKKPDDAASIVKGPFKTKDEAEKALKDAGKATGSAPKPGPPAVGC